MAAALPAAARGGGMLGGGAVRAPTSTTTPAAPTTAPTTRAGAHRSTAKRRGRRGPPAPALVPHSAQKRAAGSSLEPHWMQKRTFIVGPVLTPTKFTTKTPRTPRSAWRSRHVSSPGRLGVLGVLVVNPSEFYG